MNDSQVVLEDCECRTEVIKKNDSGDTWEGVIYPNSREPVMVSVVGVSDFFQQWPTE